MKKLTEPIAILSPWYTTPFPHPEPGRKDDPDARLSADEEEKRFKAVCQEAEAATNRAMATGSASTARAAEAAWGMPPRPAVPGETE